MEIKYKMIHSLDDNNMKQMAENLDPTIIMFALSNELASSLESMSKAKKVEDKLQHSHIVKNLCESLGVFFKIANSAMQDDFMDDDFDDDDDDF